MEYITKRTEIAETLNFGKYPVVFVEDIKKCRTDYGWRLGQVRIPSGKGYSIESDLYIYKDEKKLVTTSYGACLKSSFGWNDVKAMAKRACETEIHPESEFVLVIGNGKMGAVVKIKTGKLQLHCDMPVLIDEDMTPLLTLFGEL